MSVQAVMARISAIQDITAPAPVAPVTTTSTTPSTFQSALTSATTGTTATAATAAVPTTGTTGEKMVALAQQEVGQAEQPPGSNDSPRIAEYRSATKGGGIGPWCAYFVSYIANKAGAPLGEAGQGFANVSALSAWAQRTGHNLPAGSTPQPGDLIYWGGEHVGMVESVDADGSIHTIEGNSGNAVTRHVYGKDGGGATGYVRV